MEDNEDSHSFKLRDINNQEIKLTKNGNTYKTKIFFYDQKGYIHQEEIKITEIIQNICIFKDMNIEEIKIKEDIDKVSSQNESRKTLKFGTNNYITFDELDKLLNDFNQNNLKFSEELDNIMMINNINSLIKQQDNISKYLKCKCSDDTMYNDIDNLLSNIQNYFKQLKPLFKNFLKYINDNIKDFIQSYDKNKNKLNSMFINDNIKTPVSEFQPYFSFKNIKPDSKYLATLIISEENKEVTCSQSRISGFLGTYIPSLIKGDFSLYILSTINEKLSARIEPLNMFQKSVVFKNEIEPNELFVITIKIPNKTEENDEQIDIKFDL